MVAWATSESPSMSAQSRYTILRKIADGGTAEIFLAKQHGAQGFEKTVVLKRIFTTFYADPQFRHMLVDEAHVAMSLNHSNIVQVLDLGEAEGRYFLAMELVDGWTLDRILKRSKAAGVPIPPALALYVTAEICRALAYAHNKKRPDGNPLGIVHRDVSPHNVLLSEQGEVKLTDFGIAKAQNKTEKSLGNLIKGKVAFMSPEQASGGELDARSDLFSVGVMLYVMITRRHPFDAPTDYETLMLVKNGDFLPPETARPGLNPELYRAIRKAMGKTPADRYQKAEDMLIDVEQVMRLAFRPVGQTELQRWLADLGSKDGVPTLTREAPPVPPASRSTVGPLRAGDGQESGLVLTLDDAEEVRSSDHPPPHPGPTVQMMKPPQFEAVDRPWHGRPSVRVGGAIVILLLAAVVAAKALGGRHRPEAADATAGSAATTAPSGTGQPAPPPPTAPAPTTPGPSNPGPAAASDAQAAANPLTAGSKPDATPGSSDGVGHELALADAALGPKPAEDEAPRDAPAGDDAQDRAGPKAHAAAKAQPLSLLVKSDPEGSHLANGHQSFGTTPVTLRLRPGSSYDLTFTKPGYASLVRHYRFDGHGPQILRVSLKKAPEPHRAAEPHKPASGSAPAPKPAVPPSKSGFFSR
jgi:eukaryotic-like serine/threonine-protein kinase